MYEDMFLGREFEDRCAEMYYRGKMFGCTNVSVSLLNRPLD